jgi:3-methyladenine DNA glycosylase AlkC
MAEKYSMKDDFFNAETVAYLGGLFVLHLDVDRFQSDVMARLLDLELKERIDWIAQVLSDHLPVSFEAKADAIFDSLPPPLDPTRVDDDFGKFIYAPLGVVVENHGVEAHRDLSFRLLEAITKRFSMEWSIRVFLNRWPEETMAQMAVWADNENYHVRRLVTEGTRPKLPWGQGIAIDPTRMIPLLDRLHVDRTRYVTRSVANHMNDIAKFEPKLVVDTLRRWQLEARQDAKELAWMTRHATRTLVKDGDAGALALLGYDPNPPISNVTLMLSTQQLRIDETLEFTTSLTAETDAPLILDYTVDFVKSNGKTAPKVFKFKTFTLKAGVPQTLTKRHHFKGSATTFKLYPGEHAIILTANGKPIARAEFDVS